QRGYLGEAPVEQGAGRVPLRRVRERVPRPVLVAELLELGAIRVEPSEVAEPQSRRRPDLQGLLASMAVAATVADLEQLVDHGQLLVDARRRGERYGLRVEGAGERVVVA